MGQEAQTGVGGPGEAPVSFPTPPLTGNSVPPPTVAVPPGLFCSFVGPGECGRDGYGTGEGPVCLLMVSPKGPRMSDGETVSDVLFAYSDERVCRQLWQALEEGAPMPAVAELIQAMRATDGRVALVVNDPVVEIYAQWTGSAFEHLSISPPWHVVGYDRVDRARLEAKLDDRGHPSPILREKTPFASPSLSVDGP